MIKKLVCNCLVIITLYNCKPNFKLDSSVGTRHNIDTTLISKIAIRNFIQPYKIHIEQDLDSTLAYAVNTYSKTNGELNTAIGNLMADIILIEGNLIFNTKTHKNINAVLLNYGGIRAEIPKGIVNTRTAYQIMPFENEIVVVGLKGEQLLKAIKFLATNKRAHPVAGMQIILDENYNLISAHINGKDIISDTIYYIATSDYLYNKGDNMSFFQPNESVHLLDYKIRNMLIDYFKKVDTINPKIDNRFIRLK